MFKPVYLKKGSKYEYLVQSEDKEDDNEIIDFVPIQVIHIFATTFTKQKLTISNNYKRPHPLGNNRYK